jgi:hypothetical protein
MVVERKIRNNPIYLVGIFERKCFDKLAISISMIVSDKANREHEANIMYNKNI